MKNEKVSIEDLEYCGFIDKLTAATSLSASYVKCGYAKFCFRKKNTNVHGNISAHLKAIKNLSIPIKQREKYNEKTCCN
jgi:hypothetical protein